MSKQQSMGKCNLCGEIAGQASMTRHLSACVQPEASGLLPASEKRPPAPSFHLAIEGRDAKAYWMHVAVPVTAPQLLARNEAPQVSYQRCSIHPATQICTECAWNGEGWLCEACAVAHECGDEMCLPVVNSPRVGVCGYTG